jgi:hypothetical protein
MAATKVSMANPWLLSQLQSGKFFSTSCSETSNFGLRERWGREPM